ncbi:caspase family protein [Streptomyces sp. NBC_01235]|uniref:caspase family protein n=1 Tax=Streptomyces sp. NBC_01235 TaxID=2903788 RepID=UPI002E0DA9E4|nr:caspase family protein [Streptomyces sp. NBC_01235]
MRYLVAAGTRHYRENAELPLAHEDVDRAVDLFASMGYERVLTAVSYDPDSASFEDALADWCATPALTAEDVVVVYYAGHGDRAPTGQYRLACAGSETRRPRSWLSLPHLAEILATSPVRNVLFVVDACHAAAATAEIGTITDTIVAGRGRSDAFGAGTWLLASARHRDMALDGAFVVELAEACARGDGPSQRYLAPSTLAERVSASFVAAGNAQRAACSSVDQSERPPFFTNPAFDPYAEIVSDGRAQGDVSDLSSHFEPRGRGVEHVHDPGSYFTGRERALAQARAHLDGDEPGRLLVVTAEPGSGKSAVLGRLVLDGHADASVNAHHQTLEALVGRIAAAADVRAATPVALFTALAERRRPFRVVVDSLDEAGSAGDKAEARRIAWELLRPLGAVACVRLVVGSRRELLPHLGDRVPVVDLDDDRYARDTDPAAYVAKILGDTGAPYAAHPELALRVAHEVARRAGRCFLVARMTASALLRGPLVDTAVPGWSEQLPSDVGGAFEAYLQRLPTGRHARTVALLTTLAFGAGNGLPRRIWLSAAARLSGIALAQADIDLLLEEDGSYLAHAEVAGTKYFRLYHQELTDHLKQRALAHRDMTDLQECFVEILLELVPDKDWSCAHPYVLAHLATHAAPAGHLDDLIEDASFVVHSDPATLLPAVRQAVRRPVLAMAVERYAYLVADSDPGSVDRAALLAFVAATYGEDGLRRRASGLSPVLGDVRVEPREITPHRVVGRHEGEGYATRAYNPHWTIEQVFLPSGGRVVLAAPPRAPHVHVWRLDNPSQSTVLPHPADVVGLAVLDDDRSPARAVTLDAVGDVRIWDVADQTLLHTASGGDTILFDSGFLPDGTAVLLCGNTERVVVRSLPALDTLAEAACENPSRFAHGEIGATACLAYDEDGRVRLLVCDGRLGRVTLHPLAGDGDADVSVLLDGASEPFLMSHMHGSGGTVAAIGESRTRLTLLHPGSGRAVSKAFDGFIWQDCGFALGSEADPVFVTQNNDDLLVVRLDAPPQPVAAQDRAAGHVDRLTPALLRDGLYGVGVNDIAVRVVDIATGDAIGSAMWGHEGAVCALRLLPVDGGRGPDVLAVGNDGTARLWKWGDHERPAEPAAPSGSVGGAAPEIESLIAWPAASPGVLALSGTEARRVVPATGRDGGSTSSPLRGLYADVDDEQDWTVDSEGALHALAWAYGGHFRLESFSEAVPAPPGVIPISHLVWSRVRPGEEGEPTELTWLSGDCVGGAVSGHLLPPTRLSPHARVLAFDRILGRFRLLDAPDAQPDWTELPWMLDPLRDQACSAAFVLPSGSTALMTGVRKPVGWESSVAGHSKPATVAGETVPRQPSGRTDGRLWNISDGACDEGAPVELLDDVWLLLAHHGADGTRWVAQQGWDGTTRVVHLPTNRQYEVAGPRPDVSPDPSLRRTLVSGNDHFIRWTELPDGTPVLLLLDDRASDDSRPAPVTMWDATTPDILHRLAVPACRILWAGPAPSGETLVALSDEYGVALCHLPSGDRVWAAPLPALVTSLVPLPDSPALDLAVGTQQGVVLLRPRLSRAWQDSLGIS